MTTSLASIPLVALKTVAFGYHQGSRNGDNGYLYRGFDFSIDQGSITAIMGPSGSGKSTLGMLLAGVIRPSEGDLVLHQNLAEPSAVVYIDQNALNSVFPWQSVGRNVEYPLLRLGWSRTEASARANHLLALFQINHLAAALPRQLSGGELQRLAICRCLSWRPKLIVLDESLSALDPKTKATALAAIHSIARNDNLTVVLITHSIADALAIATRCIVLADRPVRVACDVSVECDYPREETTPGFHDAQEALIAAIRHGII